MQHKIREAGDLTYVLEIKASAEDLQDDVQQAVRKRRSLANLKGFRPGRVPLHWIRRIFKKEITEDVTKAIIEEVFEDMVTQSGKYDVLGEPQMAEFSYELDGDLHVELEFVTSPKFELQDVSGQVLEITQLKVTDELVNALVDTLIDMLREGEGELRPLEKHETIGEEGVGNNDQIFCETSGVDPATGLVLIGESSAAVDVDLGLGSTEYKDDPEYQALCKALKGHRVGDQVFVRFKEKPQEDVIVMESESVERAYRATIIEAKRLELPDVDDDWSRKVTKGSVESKEEWPAAMRHSTDQIVEIWNSKRLDDSIMSRMIELYSVKVPEGLVRRHMAEYGMHESGKPLEPLVEKERKRRKAFFRHNLAWFFIQEELTQQEEFKAYSDSAPSTGSVSDIDDKEVIERVLGAVPQFEDTPSVQRVALNYLADRFDVRVSDHAYTEDDIWMILSTIQKLWWPKPS